MGTSIHQTLSAACHLGVVLRQRLYAAISRFRSTSALECRANSCNDGQIVLNLGPDATNKLQIGNELIEFQARFGGVARKLSVPVEQVSAIYSRENGAGMAFEIEAKVLMAEL
jgi:stringent starvation protein B